MLRGTLNTRDFCYSTTMLIIYTSLSYTCRLRGQKLNQKIFYAVQGLISKTVAFISCLMNGKFYQ